MEIHRLNEEELKEIETHFKDQDELKETNIEYDLFKEIVYDIKKQIREKLGKKEEKFKAMKKTKKIKEQFNKNLKARVMLQLSKKL